MRLPSSSVWIAISLFFATFVSTTVQGIKLAPPGPMAAQLIEGLLYSVPLLGILILHELGHYWVARREKMPVSPPYFIPDPFGIVLFGTLGAVIVMRGPIRSRIGILRVAAAGPLAGFVAAGVVFLVGLHLSRVVPVSSSDGLVLGDSLLTYALSQWVFGPLPEGQDVLLHPVALAGWVGLFLTGLNLLPIGQLDGGHVLFALSRRGFFWGTRMAVAGLFVLSHTQWLPWLGLGILALFFAFHHPLPLYWEEKLPFRTHLLALFALVVWILTFVPVPAQVPGVFP